MSAASSVGVLTDSTADLRADVRDRFDLSVVPLLVNWDGQSYRDGIDLTNREFYRRLRTSKSLPKTGAPSLAAFESAFREGLEQHAELVSVNLASKLSGTFEVAHKAAQNVDPKRIAVVDSGTVSVGLGWLAEMAATWAADGATGAEIVPRLQETSTRIRLIAVVETLEYLQRGGRIGRAAALAGTLLSVKPVLSINFGEVAPLERVRTTSAALRRLIELVVKAGPVERLGAVDADAADNAHLVENQLRGHFPDCLIDRAELGPVVGTHGGPGVVGVGMLLAG